MSYFKKDVNQLGLADTEAAAVGGVTPASKSISAAASAWSRELASKENGGLAVYVKTSGSGTITVEVFGSPEENDTTNSPYALVPDGQLATGFTAANGAWLFLEKLASPWYKIKITEDGGAASVTIAALWTVRTQ